MTISPIVVGALVSLQYVNQVDWVSSETYRPYWFEPKWPTTSWWGWRRHKGSRSRTAGWGRGTTAVGRRLFPSLRPALGTARAGIGAIQIADKTQAKVEYLI